MNKIIQNLEKLNSDLENTKQFFLEHVKELKSPIQIFTHIDSDGITSGAILGKALYRENLPFQITVLKQLEKEEIVKLIKKASAYENFIIFSDFGSGQYLELQNKFHFNNNSYPFLILDHHLPQNISNKDEIDLIKEVHNKTRPWHVNSYFYDVNGSNEISAAGLCYFFAKKLNDLNSDLSQIAIVGAIGDIQNQSPNKTFSGLNNLIVEDAKNNGFLEIIDDLNFSTLKPLNEAIAYSKEIELPGLTKDANKTLKFLQTIGILMENSNGNIKTLNDLNKDEKQKVSSAIIEYASLKLDITPNEIVKNLIVKRYLLKREAEYSDLHDSNEYSNILNACGRTNNSSLGIAIAMGDRKNSYQKALEVLVVYKKNLLQALNWIKQENKIQEMDHIQYFFGEKVIPETIIGTISSMLVLDKSDAIAKNKPLFGIATREEEKVYKISGRAREDVVNKGVNLSEVIREALKRLNLDILGGGHPPAAGTKIPFDKIHDFLKICDEIVKKQLESGRENNTIF